MSEHFLKRNHDNEPVCGCGYRPDILDNGAPVGKQWKARTAVLDHVQARHECDDYTPAQPTPPRSPFDAFGVTDARYPRAGVRRTLQGEWLLALWDADETIHFRGEPVFADREEACEVGRMIIGAHRQSGTTLADWPAE